MQRAGADPITLVTTSARPHAFRFFMNEMRRGMPVSRFRSKRRPPRFPQLNIVPTFLIAGVAGWLVGLGSLLMPDDLAAGHLTLLATWSDVRQSMPDQQLLAAIEQGLRSVDVIPAAGQ
jgi:hypothetical protein